MGYCRSDSFDDDGTLRAIIIRCNSLVAVLKGNGLAGRALQWFAMLGAASRFEACGLPARQHYSTWKKRDFHYRRRCRFFLWGSSIETYTYNEFRVKRTCIYYRVCDVGTLRNGRGGSECRCDSDCGRTLYRNNINTFKFWSVHVIVYPYLVEPKKVSHTTEFREGKLSDSYELFRQ